MGQKVNPTGYRIGVMEDWRSRWYATKLEFKDLIGEDFKIRKFVKQFYGNIHHRDKFKGKKEDAPVNAGIPKVEIERTRDAVKVIIFTARPGIIIGRKGQEVDRLKAELEDLTGRRMDLRTGTVQVDNDLIAGPFNLDLRDAGEQIFLLDEFANFEVFDQQVAELLFRGIPPAAPRFLLTRSRSPSQTSASTTTLMRQPIPRRRSRSAARLPWSRRWRGRSNSTSSAAPS